MAKRRYKIRKEQLERVVESFVMESAAPEAKKHVKGGLGEKMVDKRSNTKDAPEKDWGINDEPSHAPEAKKHVKGEKGSGKMVEKRSNSKSASTTEKRKMKHAPEAKKHVKGSVSESTELTEEELNEFFGGRKRRKAALEDDFKLKARLWRKKGVIGGMTRTDFLEFMSAAEEDDYQGKVGLDKQNGKIVYRPSSDINWAGLGLNRSGSFGGTGAGG
jgi:hypothetical protein